MKIQAATAPLLPRALPEGQVKEWGVLVYNAGETDEGLMSTHNLLDLQQVGSDAQTHVICHNYRSPWIYERFLGIGKEHVGSRQYYLEKDPQSGRNLAPGSELGHFASFLRSTPERITSPELAPPEQGKVHESAQLKAFLLQSMKKFPARHYCLILSGHGSGFAGQLVTAQGRLSNEDLGQVLREVAQEIGRPLDLVNLNTCYSAGLEVLQPLAGGAQAAVASQSTVCAANQSMAPVLQTLQNSLQQGQHVSGEELAQLFVEEARRQPLSNLYTPTLSALNLDRVAELGHQVGELHRSVLQNQVDPALLREVLASSQKLHYAQVPRAVYTVDLGSFVGNLGQRCDQPEIQKLCQQISQTLDRAVLAEQHQEPQKESAATRLLRPILGKAAEDYSGCSGLTIYYEDQPARPGHRLAQVENTQLGQQWQIRQFVEYIQQGAELPQAGWGERLGEKVRSLELKAHKAVGIPYLVPVAKHCLKIGAFLAASAALNHLGVPVAEMVMGPYLAGSGLWTAAQQGARALSTATQAEPLSLSQREKLIDAASNATLGLTLGSFGLHLMGALPASVVWPLVGVATAARVGRLVAKVASHHSAVQQHRQEVAHFGQLATVQQKLKHAETFRQISPLAASLPADK